MHVICSSVFSFRARCKFCKGLPKYFYFILDRFNYQDAKTTFYVSNLLIKRNGFNPQPDYEHKKISGFKASFSKIPSSRYKACRLTDHAEETIVDVITCACSETTWVYKDSNKASLKNRKSRFPHPTPKRFL